MNFICFKFPLEDFMKKGILVFVFLCILCPVMIACAETNVRTLEAKEWFADENTYVLECYGYPKQSENMLKSELTAEDAAVLNAQTYARARFNSNVDVIRQGEIVFIKNYETYSKIRYKIVGKNLRSNYLPPVKE